MNRQMSNKQLRAKTGISPPPPLDDQTTKNRIKSKSSRVSNGPKHQLLNKYRESDINDNIFGEEEPLEAIDVDLDDEFKTLKLQDIQELQNPHHSPQLSSPPKRINSKPVKVDAYDEEFEFEEEDLKPKKYQSIKPEGILQLSPDKQSMVTSSPKSHRISLSEYSEEGEEGEQAGHNDVDTEVTSNLNEEDFDDIDNIFGNEESGIYSSNGKNRFQSILKTQQMKLQNDAEIEERELIKKYNRIKQRQQQEQKIHGQETHEVSTLKLKNLDQELDPFGTWKQEQAQAVVNDYDNTINYEYTKDDFENFEDGFEIDDYPKRLKVKKSMPNVTFKTGSSNDFGSLKKFQSSYNLPSDRNGSNPKFDNKVMRKLDRIPSFYNHQRLNDMLEQNENIKMTKQQLLQQYQEIDKQHKQSNDRILTMKKSMSVPGNYGQQTAHSNMKHSASTKGHSRRSGKPIGLVRYLNEVPHTPNSNMRYNQTSKVWEGNDIELLKFNNNLKKPSLIKFQDYIKKYRSNKQDDNDDGGMVFDDKNLRWVSKTGEEEEDIFEGLHGKDENELDDVLEEQGPEISNKAAFKPPTITPSISNLNSRGVSTFTARTASSANLSSRKSSVKKGIDSYETGNDFLISKKNIDRFLKEEMKITKKTNNWFHQGEVYQIDSEEGPSMDYYWDIRNLVIDNNGNGPNE